jgi:hypothetical protein
MKKEIIDNSCTVCGHNEYHNEFICDTCGKLLSMDGYIIHEIGIPSSIKLTFNYIDYDFCDNYCLLDFIIAEIKKEKK